LTEIGDGVLIISVFCLTIFSTAGASVFGASSNFS
jgi:hypothetical protein